jgi:serine/threonine-protein kinase
MIRRVLPVAALAVGIACAASAAAQDGMTKATAEALFADGRRLMASGDYVAACPKFAASQKLDPGIGTTLNLADCYEKLGRVASAWAEFRSAASGARAAGATEREQLATERARSLEARLSYLTITAPARSAGLQIARDGAPIDPALLGTAIPIDPGAHTIEAVAPGKSKWSVSIDVGSSASRITVSVPELGVGVAPGAPAAVRPVADPAQYGAAQRGLGIGVAALGAIALGAGTVFGLKASSNWDEAKSHCTAYPHGCDVQAVSLAQDARAASNASTVSFVIGVAGLGGGALLFFTAPKNPSTEKALSLRILPTEIALRARF